MRGSTISQLSEGQKPELYILYPIPRTICPEPKHHRSRSTCFRTFKVTLASMPQPQRRCT
eukprot:1060640-Rhodomonas_salina.2